MGRVSKDGTGTCALPVTARGLPCAIETATGWCCFPHRLRCRGSALHLEQKPGHHERRDADRRTGVRMAGHDRLACRNITDSVFLQIHDETCHLQNLIEI